MKTFLQSYPATIKHIPLIAGKFPKLKMVIDHIAKPHYMQARQHSWDEAQLRTGIKTCIQASGYDSWAADMAEAAKHKNVFCKLSGLVNEVIQTTNLNNIIQQQSYSNFDKTGVSLFQKVPFWTPESFRPYVAHCLAVFGPDRCMFGRF